MRKSLIKKTIILSTFYQHSLLNNQKSIKKISKTLKPKNVNEQNTKH